MGVHDRLVLLPPLAEFITELAGGAADEFAAPGDESFGLASLRIDMPIEIEMHVDEDGATAVRATPPTQWTATTIMPVLHRLMVHIELTTEQ